MQNQQPEYSTFATPLGMKHQMVLKCVVKNTFLEMVPEESSESKCCSRVRSLSESCVSLMRHMPRGDSDGEMAEESFERMNDLKNFCSLSKSPSSTDIGSYDVSTPRFESKESNQSLCTTATSDSQTEEVAEYKEEEDALLYQLLGYTVTADDCVECKDISFKAEAEESSNPSTSTTTSHNPSFDMSSFDQSHNEQLQISWTWGCTEIEKVSSNPSTPTSTSSNPSFDMSSYDQSHNEQRQVPSELRVETSRLSWADRPASRLSWADEADEDLEVPSEVFEALHKLTDLVAEQQLKREDLMTYEVTAQLYPFIPVDDEGNVTSLGSILHFEGICSPCAFLQKERCNKKDLCVHCHFEHDVCIIRKKHRSRKSKSNRKRDALLRVSQAEAFQEEAV